MTHTATDNAFAAPTTDMPLAGNAVAALRESAVPNASGGTGTWCWLVTVADNRWAMATRSTDDLAQHLANRTSGTMAVDAEAVLNGVEVAVARSSRPGVELTAQDLRRPGQLRRIARAQLHRLKLDGLADSAVLLISELVTNALVHGQGTEFALRLIHSASEVRIEVYDGSAVRPYVCAAGPDDESGRGMTIVASTADSWGVSEDGRRTWCTLAVTTAARCQ
ncbi:ATP-binding protein [Streptomyces sp. NPDC005408]|uniref:ATP-binding protein n=1 Tax=Streptomyces sp. NPDC005408 TaxID=3155341 RepID=UPI0033BAEB7E